MYLIKNDTINVLIVDDKIDNVLALEASLESDHLNIFTTTDPKNVVEMCIENDISIALIDVKMPEIDGFDLLDLIKSNPKIEKVMVILITGFSMSSEHVVKGLNKGAVDYLFKPLDLYITMAKVNSLVSLVNHQKEIERKNIELEKYQKELYHAIELTEKSKVLKENFLSNMSHEIRTPLNAITGLTHLLKNTSINAEQGEIVKLMEYSSSALLGIVNDILESAQLDEGRIQITRSKSNIVSIVKTVCDLTMPMANEKGLSLTCEIDSEVPEMLMLDSLRLNQILVNLINNSIKFTHSGGIYVSLKLIEQSENKVCIEISVRDTGIGIANSAIDSIFNRFEQIEDKTWQKFGGNGLGLSIVKRLVELKGGELDVKSELGKGSIFTYRNWYEIAEDVKKMNTDSTNHKLAKFDDILVLLAEDNVINQFVTIGILKDWNIKVDIANNGLEAFEKLKNNNYNLILMDTHMPVMNGHEATKKIRQEMHGLKKHIPIISFSASVIGKEQNEAKSAGVDDFIEKPFEHKALHKKISALVGKYKPD